MPIPFSMPIPSLSTLRNPTTPAFNPDVNPIWDSIVKHREATGQGYPKIPAQAGAMPMSGPAPIATPSLPAPINPNAYKVAPPETYEQYRTANPEAEGVHEGFGNRMKHGGKAALLAGLQALANYQGRGGVGEMLAHAGGAAGTALGIGAFRPELADRYIHEITRRRPDQARYEQEATAANQAYDRDMAARKQQIEDTNTRVGWQEKAAQIQKIQAEAEKLRRPDTPKYTFHTVMQNGQPVLTAIDPISLKTVAMGADAKLLQDQAQFDAGLKQKAAIEAEERDLRERLARGGWANAANIAKGNNATTIEAAKIRSADGGGDDGITIKGPSAKTLPFDEWKKQLPEHWKDRPDDELKQKYNREKAS